MTSIYHKTYLFMITWFETSTTLVLICLGSASGSLQIRHIFCLSFVTGDRNVTHFLKCSGLNVP
jgi:hypothetical protein